MTAPGAVGAVEAPITFSRVINDDHNAINRYAGRLKRARTASDRARLLREVTWRLVRHDVSEDLVMRPAFVEHLGAEGQQMAEHDRTEHERAKSQLLALADVPFESADFDVVLDRLFADLLEHMRVESGEQIPSLERLLDPLESQRLGREYMKSQVLTPELEWPASRISPSPSPSPGGIKRRRVWVDIDDYARSDLARFRDIYAQLTDEQTEMGVKLYYRQHVHGKL
ncbi:hypothetical protein A1O3_02559 [Capronia epimyces CBS 606.96]|uniref:Hemerythrin-like domain-containing protein n=1 Tax=Capronia epimyces CBS 606.96 TaxID=1182542 RepID=W9Y9H3_9EURO|nr:uncharacterized protein A1O3_02559 [Capronia epimyces CBS 606.96]EXJ89492.1 hypothetical protein A1O3_02559 [Capronia epimyces CBS 606.96]